jgi:hypothetical protein
VLLVIIGPSPRDGLPAQCMGEVPLSADRNSHDHPDLLDPSEPMAVTMLSALTGRGEPDLM